MDFRNLANQISDVGLPQLLTLNTIRKRISLYLETMAKWCYLIFVHHQQIQDDFQWRKKQKQRHEFKAGLKSLFSWREIEREETMRMIELKQDAYQISMCWCLFALGVFQNMQHIGMSEHEAARKSPLAEIQLKKISTLFLSLSSVFFPLIAYTALKCKESICLFSRCSHLTTVNERMFAWLFAFAEKYEVKRMYCWNASHVRWWRISIRNGRMEVWKREDMDFNGREKKP